MFEIEAGDFGEDQKKNSEGNSSIRRCPHCAEPINPEAAVCPHCNEPLGETITVDLNRHVLNRPLRRMFHLRNIFLVLATMAFALGVYGFFVVQRLSSDYYISAGDRVMAAGDFAAAVEYYRQAVQVGSQDPNTYEKLGWAEYQLARDTEALTHFESALALDPNRTSSLFGAGLSAYQLREYETAVAHLSRAVEISPEHAGAYQYLGLAEYRLGDFDTAYGHLTEAWVYNPKNATTLYYLARIFDQRGDAEAAIEKYNEAEAAGFDAGAIAYARGLAQMQLGNFEPARDDLQIALTAYPTRVEIPLSLAKAFYLLGEYASAGNQLTAIQTSVPPELQQEYLVISGWVALREGRFDAALDAFNAWLNLKPSSAEALNAIGWATYYAGDCQTANPYFQSAASSLTGEWMQKLDSFSTPQETPQTGLELQCQ